MKRYIIRRLLYALFTLLALSIVAFVLIQIPPGDYVTSYVTLLENQGDIVDDAEVAALRAYYGLDASLFKQYLLWSFHLLQGDMGMSLRWERPVTELILERLPWTVLIAATTLVFSYLIAIPIGIYVATHQYGIGDYTFSVIGYFGLATPNFMIALLIMFLFARYFGMSVGGLFSPEYVMADWSLARVLDLLKHLWIPVVVVGTYGTAGLIRVMRGTLLDELGRQYVITARAKGLTEGRLLFKYPVRIALNPIVSSIGWQLPRIISGQTIVSIVLSLPTTGPLMLNALMSQDIYLAGSIVMLIGLLAVVGVFISDLLLVVIDPRVRFERRG